MNERPVAEDISALVDPGVSLHHDDMAESRVRATLNAMPHMVWSTRPDGYHDFYNDRWYQFTGTPRGSTDGDGWAGLFHEEDQPEAWRRWRHSLETGEPYEVEYRLRRADGVWRWHLGRARPIRGFDGTIERWIGTCTDIHDLKEAETSLSLVARELTHRIKNMFAVANAMIAMGARQGGADVRAFAAATTARLDSLARIQDFIRPGPAAAALAGASSGLHELIRAIAEPHAGDGADIVVVEGTDMAVSASRATSIVLVLHELFTNALKHGALSREGGQVRIVTRREGDRLRLDWTETGGPVLGGPPEHQGFGSTLSQRIVRRQLGGTLVQEWKPEGLSLAITVPVARLMD